MAWHLPHHQGPVRAALGLSCARCWSRDNGDASRGEFQAHQGGEENLVVRHTNPAICDKYSLVQRVHGVDWSQRGKPREEMMSEIECIIGLENLTCLGEEDGGALPPGGLEVEKLILLLKARSDNSGRR